MDAGVAAAGAIVVVVEAEVVAAEAVAAVAAEEDEAAAAEEGEAATRSSSRVAGPSSWFIARIWLSVAILARFTAAGQPRVRSVRLFASAAVSGSSNAAVTSGWIGDSRGDGFTVLTCARAPLSSARQHDAAIRDE